MEGVRWKALTAFEKGVESEEGFLRWLGKQEGRDSVQSKLKHGSDLGNGGCGGGKKGKGKRGGEGSGASSTKFARLSKDETRKAVQSLFHSYTQGSAKKGGETGQTKEILVSAVVKNLKEGKYERTSSSLEAAARGKVVAGAAGSKDGADHHVKVETHGLVDFEEDGTCCIPRKALEDSNQLKGLAAKALKFVDLVRGTCSPFEEFTKLELELKSHTLAVRAAKVKAETLKPLEESFQEEKDILVQLKAEGPNELMGQILGGGKSGYVKAVDETLALQLDLFHMQRRLEVVDRERQELNLLLQMGAMTNQREENAARLEQLARMQNEILEGTNKSMGTKLPVVMQSWYLLLQSYYQHLLDRVYQKNKDLLSVLEGLPEDAKLSDSDREKLEGHWKTQYDGVSKFLTEWQANFESKDGKGQMTLEKASGHLQSVRTAFKEWVSKDIEHLTQLGSLKQSAGDSLTKVQIVEIDSDDSDSESESGEEEEGGASVELNLKSFADLSSSSKAALDEVGSKERGLKKVAAAYDRARLGMHNLALAFLVSEVYSHVVDLYCFHQADKGMQLLLQVEEQKKQKKQKAREKEKEREREREREEKLHASRKQEEKEEKEEVELVVDEAFQEVGGNIFSVLEETKGKKEGKAVIAKKEVPQPTTGVESEKPKRKNKKRKPKSKETAEAFKDTDRVVVEKMTEEEGVEEEEEEETRHLKTVLAKRQAHLHLSVELAKAELEAAQKKYEKAQHQLRRFNQIISN
ncbi:hypothetical protein A3770_13p69530 [Chloropicon primus]|uniref:Uncharacterized protein n=1 Tax=Chloropicon primus TaxID=1764295 RepID=A0A5B8MXL0_9CHLO|nr:hypothetical protein A3770_13p69530 [Chloropicon primus]|eukprot:QDZ24435.1 hypothetical protein A3770_13p69530 [Chloropicon primus]